MAGFSSFDDDVAAGSASQNAGAALPVGELPQDQQRYGTLTPNPAEFVSDHSAEGAPWLPTARDIPQDPPQSPLWRANHDGPSVPADAGNNQRGIDSAPHAGSDSKYAYGLLNIGRPFLAVQNRVRHLRTSVYDATGRIVNPADAPSAPTQIWNSEHNTAPRWIGFDVAPLFDNYGSGPTFSVKPDNPYGVSDSMPDSAPRQYGSVLASEPDNPYVAPTPNPVPPDAINYESGF